MKHFKLSLCIVALACAGCSDSNYRAGTLTPPAAGNNVNFTTFVTAQFATPPSQTAAPVEVDATTFTFPDNDDPTTFNTIISNAP
jgi:hypothetical protein